MSIKKQALILVVSILVAFAGGRFMTPEKIKIETKIVEVEKKTDNKKTNTSKDTKKRTTIVEVKLPTGATTTTTTIDESKDIDRTTQSDTVDDKSKNIDTLKEVTKSSGHTNLYLLGGVDVKNPANGMIYGLGVSRNVLGPITVGAQGRTDSTVSLTIGLEL